jgi:hypothetical protein
MWDRQQSQFAVTDVSYIVFVNKENKLEGIITIQKLVSETIEDYIVMVYMLAFHIGTSGLSKEVARCRTP